MSRVTIRHCLGVSLVPVFLFSVSAFSFTVSGSHSASLEDVYNSFSGYCNIVEEAGLAYLEVVVFTGWGVMAQYDGTRIPIGVEWDRIINTNAPNSIRVSVSSSGCTYQICGGCLSYFCEDKSSGFSASGSCDGVGFGTENCGAVHSPGSCGNDIEGYYCRYFITVHEPVVTAICNISYDIRDLDCLGADSVLSVCSSSSSGASSSGDSSSSFSDDGSSSSYEPSSSSSDEPSSSSSSEPSSSSSNEPPYSSSGELSSSSSEEFPSSSSSSEPEYSSSFKETSSSSLGAGNVCAVFKPLPLQKPVNYYDDWVYIGKETYGSRYATSRTIEPGTKFFDVLGRVYDKMKARIKYYVFKDAIRTERSEVAMEFEVWARIIKDEEGNDVQVFIKEDKANGLRKDSSFYYNGYWEVFEFDDAGKETRFRAVSGISSISRYDDRERLKEYYRTDGKDTLESHRYEWKNGRLVRMTANGVTRNYIYGKTLRDTVRVEPSDESFNYHRGYNGTAGKIPEEWTPEYEIFSLNPYGHIAFGDEEYDEYELLVAYLAAKNSGQLNVLKRVTISGCVNENDGMPRAQCIRYERNDIPHNAPKNGLYGHSDFKLSISHKCECNAFGKYQPSFNGNTINEEIEVYLSIWRYNDEEKYWQEHCRLEENLQRTYYHEVQHIKNGRHIAATLNAYVDKNGFETKKECENESKRELKKLREKWEEWYKKEQNHANPSSPKIGYDRYDYICN